MLELIHYLSAAYLILSLVLMMTRKYPLRYLMILPPICQIASVLVLKELKFQPLLTALLFLLNLALVIWVDMVEKKQMGQTPAAEETEGGESQAFPLDDRGTNNSFTVDTDLFSAASGTTPNVEGDLELTRPAIENKPINEVAPVQQEIFDASKSEMEEMIDSMLSSGDLENAKRYLRMLAFFAKDETSRKIAEKKLAEINKMA